ncbi:MAG: hypothetical protein ACPGJU_07945, partial [Coraliomargarita sp.]
VRAASQRIFRIGRIYFEEGAAIRGWPVGGMPTDAVSVRSSYTGGPASVRAAFPAYLSYRSGSG